MRGCGSALVLLVAVVAFLGAIAYALLARAPTLAEQLTPVPVSGTAAARLDTKLASAQAADAPVTVAIDEQEATSKLVALLETEPGAPRVDNAQVHFRDGQVYVSGTYRDAPIPVNFVVVGRLAARDGQLVPTIDRIDTGRFPLPESITAQLTDLAADTTRLNNELALTVTDVQTLDGRVVVTGKRK